MLCRLCNGTGSLMTFPNGKCQWWECCGCGGSGVTLQHGPAAITIHAWREKFRRKK